MTRVPARAPRAVPPRTLPVLALCTGLLAGPLGSIPAAASGPRPPSALLPADTGDDVAIVLDEIDPVVLTPGEPLTLTGRLVNQGAVPHRVTSLTATVSGTTLTSRSEVDRWLDDELDLDRTTTLGDDTVGPVVAAAGAVPFSVTVPAAVTNDLPEGPQVLPLVISAGDEREPGGAAAHPVRLRSTLVSAGGEEVEEPLDTSWVVPLTLPPDPDLLSPTEQTHAQAWVSAVGPDSAISGWVTDLAVPGVTYVVDPSTLVGARPAPALRTPPEQGTDPADTGADPLPAPSPDAVTSTTEAPDGGSDAATKTVPAPVPDDPATTQSASPPAQTEEAEAAPATAAEVDQAVATLRTQLAGLPDDQVWWLPSEDPDVVRMVADRPPQDQLGRLLSTQPAGAQDTLAPLLSTGRHDVAWPVDPAPDADAVTQISDLFRSARDEDDTAPGLGVVLLARESLTADSGAAPRRGAVPLEEPEDVVGLGADSWTSALVARSQAEAEQSGSGAAAQQVLAHTLGTYLEDPGAARELVIAPPRLTPAPPEVLAQLSEGWRTAPWLRSVTAQELVQRAGTGDTVQLTGEHPQEAVLGDLAELLAPGRSPLDRERTAALARNAGELDDLEEVVRDTTATQSWRASLAALWSSRWRSHEEEWSTARAVVREDVRSALQGVTVTPSTVNFLTDQGEISVTVVNDLGVALDDLVLEVVASNGRLQVIRQPDPVSIGADSRASVSFEARSITRGETRLTATLRTPDGTTLGEPAPIEVRVQPTGIWVYWVLGGLAGVVLVLGLARAVRRGPRASGRSDTRPEEGR